MLTRADDFVTQFISHFIRDQSRIIRQSSKIDDEVLTESDTDFTVSSHPNEATSVVNESEIDDEIDDDNSEQTDHNRILSIKHTEALDILKEIRIFAYAKENECLLEKVVECISLVQDDLITNKTKQASITDFFSKSTD